MVIAAPTVPARMAAPRMSTCTYLDGKPLGVLSLLGRPLPGVLHICERSDQPVFVLRNLHTQQVLVDPW